MELIDKETVINGIKKQQEKLNPERENYNVCNLTCIAIEEFIERFPTVDAVPVVHGHWIKHPRAEYEDYDVCSACGTDCKTRTKYIHNGSLNVMLDKFAYCPNCGAKMDEERKDNEAD